MTKGKLCPTCLCKQELALLRHVLPTLCFTVEEELNESNDPLSHIRNNLGGVLRLMEQHQRAIEIEITKERRKKIKK